MTLLNKSNLTSRPIERGDAGIILRADGSFDIFNCFEFVGDPPVLTPHQHETGERLLAFSVALQIPDIMSLLKSIAHDRDIVGEPLEPIRGDA
jgi:hypothetical protein